MLLVTDSISSGNKTSNNLWICGLVTAIKMETGFPLQSNINLRLYFRCFFIRFIKNKKSFGLSVHERTDDDREDTDTNNCYREDIHQSEG